MSQAGGSRHVHHNFGTVAQLGERLVCTQEVVGSIPIGSINTGVVQWKDASLRRKRSEVAGRLARRLRVHEVRRLTS